MEISSPSHPPMENWLKWADLSIPSLRGPGASARRRRRAEQQPGSESQPPPGYAGHEERGYLTEKGFEPQYGARPLQRTIQREVMNPLPLAILDGRFQPGDTVRVDAGKGNGLEFSRDAATEEEGSRKASASAMG
jgi:hypothetical protein